MFGFFFAGVKVGRDADGTKREFGEIIGKNLDSNIFNFGRVQELS